MGHNRTTSLLPLALLVLVLVCLSLQAASQQTRIRDNQIVSGTVGDGKTYTLPTAGKVRGLLQFNVEPTTTDQLVQYILNDNVNHYIATIQAPLKRGQKSTEEVCHPFTNQTSYNIAVTGAPGAPYKFRPDLLDNNGLTERKPFTFKIGGSRPWESYYFFQSDKGGDDRPMEIWVKNGDDKTRRRNAVLSVSHKQCYNLGFYKDQPQSVNKNMSYFTFDRAGVMSISNVGSPEMSKGLWFLGFHSIQNHAEKSITVTVRYAMRYGDYMWPIFGLLVIYPAVIFCFLLVTFLLAYFAQRSHDAEGEELPSGYCRKEIIFLTIAAFFFFWIPAVQLSVNKEFESWNTGNRDICTYNEKCQRPAIGLFTFNNIWSNFPYVACGVLLLFYTRLVQATFKSLCPRDFSIIYALSFALIGEGILSATYHICPSEANFQFDTCFMFVLCALAMYEVYRKQFKSISSGGRIFFFLSILIALNYCGSLVMTYPSSSARDADEYGFKVVIMCAFFIPIFLIATRWVYYHEKKSYWSAFKEFITPGVPKYKGRLMFLGFVMTLVTVLIWTTSNQISMFLYCMVACALCAFFTYSVRQLGKEGVAAIKEKKAKNPLYYILWFFIIANLAGWWAYALSLFTSNDTDKNLDPEESRALNAGCYWQDFYNRHDIWHFTSAIALMFIVLGLIHYDADEVTNPEDTILEDKKAKYADKYADAQPTDKI
eukprot:TRINITY_DN3518_c0_g1_i1.p1 TRINITY_DN3518_c0_g1~~TRINITY_DN3518_c0_g1_i1.p1  ORF type:complete len:711 (-),score=268.08 TRINITY_DN3518_c0_g1_i1:122-2254(-)